MYDQDNTSTAALMPVRERDGQQVVSGRDLHAFLQVKTAYKDWMPRMIAYGFIEGQDFCSVLSESTGGRPRTDHAVTIDMAKEVSMIQRTERGKQARQYFITCEKQLHTQAKLEPSEDEIVLKALQIQQRNIKALEAKVAEDRPKVEYHDRYVSEGDVLTIETWGRQYGLTRTEAFDLLRGKNIIFKHIIGRHWSNKQQKQVEDYEHRARQARSTYAFFEQRPHHGVARHYNGQVRHTLYVRAQYALELAKAAGIATSEVSA